MEANVSVLEVVSGGLPLTRVKATNRLTGFPIHFETLQKFRKRVDQWRDLEDWHFKVVK